MVLWEVVLLSANSIDISMNCSSVAVSLVLTSMLLIVGCLRAINLGDRNFSFG